MKRSKLTNVAKVGDVNYEKTELYFLFDNGKGQNFIEKTKIPNIFRKCTPLIKFRKV